MRQRPGFTNASAVWGRVPCVAYCLVLLAAGAACSCSVAFDYPDSRTEANATLCADGIDNDFDGLTDCDQPTCDGFCREEGKVRCIDLRDNNGDELVDSRDPACWPVIAPRVTRCASQDATSFTERFDATLSAARWFPFGTLPDTDGSVAELQAPVGRDNRPDRVLGFNTEGPPEGVLGGLGSVSVLDGDWSVLSLSFRARLGPGGLARIALVPAGLARLGDSPVEGAAAASVVVELDARAEPAMTLRASHKSVSLPWGASDGWHAVTLVADKTELVAGVDGAEVRLERPPIPASRLVIWGEARRLTEQQSAVQLDDLRLKVGARYPCDAAVPQIPLGSSCRAQPSKLAEEVGHSVALAGAQGYPFCAVVTSAAAGDTVPSAAQSWTSEDGAEWAFGGMLTSSSGERLAGAGVAFDGESGVFRAAVGTRAGSEVRLSVLASPDCATWSAGSYIASLPPDAESPSYVFAGASARHEVYFTRPPAGGAARTLWRLRSDDGVTFASSPEQVAEFPQQPPVNAPVAISKTANGDLLAVHATSSPGGTSGLGILVAASSALETWFASAVQPTVASGTAEDGFDSNAIVSGALSWERGKGFLLYGARGQPFPGFRREGSLGSLTVGTALLSPGDSAQGISPAPKLPEVCGDAACNVGETCDVCPIDCGVCDGELQYSDRFDSAEGWQPVTPGPSGVVSSIYISSESSALALEPGRAGWMTRLLPFPLEGDFELSFDFHVVAPPDDPSLPRCTAYVGIGRAPTTTVMDPEGVFVQVDQQLPCSDQAPAFGSYVKVRRRGRTSVELTEPLPGLAVHCAGVATGVAEAWHHVVLRRESGRVSVRVLGPDGCELAAKGSTEVAYIGALDSLESVLIGWGGAFGESGWSTSCPEGSASMSVDNLVIRSLACAPGASACAPSGAGPSVCVELQTNPEHCGGCFQPVKPSQSCLAGSPVCQQTLCPDPASGTEACVDLESSPAHCGACGNEVGQHEDCFKGLRVASLVLTPADYLIDSTEVTRAQYADWLSTGPSTAGQSAVCDWNSSFEPLCGGLPGERPSHPVGCVDWCDAYAYCKAVGKRLCGKIGGGTYVSKAAGKNRSESQWFYACSAGDENTYPYSGDYDATRCMGAEHPEAQCIPTGSAPVCDVVETASLATCQSEVPGFAGVFDLSGNASELTDDCQAQTGSEDGCAAWGGGANGSKWSMRCQSETDSRRDSFAHDRGFRCCAF